MGKQARLKKERREARVKAGITRGPRKEKVGNLSDLTDDAEKLLRGMHNHVKNRIKLTVLEVVEAKKKGDCVDDEDQEYVRAGVSCDKCTAKKGCCTLSVSALMFEGLPVARRLQAAGMDTPLLRTKLHAAGDAMEASTMDDWFDTATSCVFLGFDQKCTIYNVRPSACRHHVVFSPPKRCSLPRDQPTLQFGSEQELTTAFNWNIAIAESFFGFKDPSQTGVMLVGSFPKVVVRILDALDHDDYRKALREQDWPTVENPPNMR